MLARPLGKDGRGGVHIHLIDITAIAERRPDSLVLEERAKIATEREAFLREREEFMTYRREEMDAIWELRKKAEDAVIRVADRLESWEDRITRSEAASGEKDKALIAAIQRADIHETARAAVATLTYFGDRATNFLALRGVKSIQDIPEDMARRFGEFLAWESTCAFLKNLPDSESKWAKDFMRFGAQERQAILRAITVAMSAEKGETPPSS